MQYNKILYLPNRKCKADIRNTDQRVIIKHQNSWKKKTSISTFYRQKARRVSPSEISHLLHCTTQITQLFKNHIDAPSVLISGCGCSRLRILFTLCSLKMTGTGCGPSESHSFLGGGSPGLFHTMMMDCR